MTEASAFRAVLKSSFEVTGRGTVLSVEILAGKVAVGDRLVVPTLDGRSHIVDVVAVDFLDFDIGRPTFRLEVGLTVDDIRPGEVAVGTIIHSAESRT